MSALGALLGLVAGLGGWLLLASVWARRTPSLAERIAPFVRDAARTSKLLGDGGTGTPFGVLGRIVRPFAADGAAMLDRFLGGARSVRRRLTALGSAQSLEMFRFEQLMWGVIGAIIGIALTVVVFVASGGLHVVAAVLFVITGLISGVLARDWWLSVQTRKREQAILAEFPVVAELLALAVTAGEAPTAALDRVARLCQGELSKEISVALSQARTGVTLPSALQAMADRSRLELLVRFVDGVVIALERGTPLADVLRAQAADVREAGKRELLAAGGRRELIMMAPVVFLILPVTVLFALYPGLVHITLLTK